MGIDNIRGRHYRKPALWKRIFKWTLLALLIIILSVGLAGFIFVYRTLGKVGENTEVIYEARQQLDIPDPDKPANILVMGTDDDPDGNTVRSDTLMLVRVDTDGNCLSMLSIPRDLIVDIPGYGEDKINSAYANGGVDLTIETVRDLTGQPIHHFVMINYDGFREAVDEVGGVYVDVDRKYFNDNKYALPGEEYEPIDIEPGYQRLNGDDALAYVRYRHTDNDFMRIRRQQYFLRDVQSQSLNWSNVTKVPDLADVFASNTTSDISRSDIVSLTKFILDVDRDHIFQLQAPIEEMIGGPSGSYLMLSEYEMEDVLEKFETPKVERPDPEEAAQQQQDELSPTTRETTIEILNGNGVDGAANSAAEALLASGCASVTVSGNAQNKYERNQIYFREGSEKAADEIGAMFVPYEVSTMPADLDTDADLVVVVGSSFEHEPDDEQTSAAAPLNFETDSDAGQMWWKNISDEVSFDVMKPTDFPVEFAYVDANEDAYSGSYEENNNFRAYEIETDDGPREALKVQVRDQFGDTWGIMQTTFTDVPLLENPTLEREIEGRNYRFYYAGSDLRYLAWEENNVAYWISNSLQNSLSEDTMIKLAVSFEIVK